MPGKISIRWIHRQCAAFHPTCRRFFTLPYLLGIDIGEGKFNLQHEYFSIRREVPLGGDAVQADATGMYGNAVGRVEGDTVIIESAGFPDLEAGMASDFDPNGVGADVPSSTQKEFTERYTLSEDGNKLMVELHYCRSGIPDRVSHRQYAVGPSC